MKNQVAPSPIDVQAFADAGESLTGTGTVGQHQRLMDETAGQGTDQPLTWSVHGELRNREHLTPDAWLHLQVQTVLSLVCQRCLEKVDVDLAVDRWFRFVAEESTAAAQDDQSEEDVLVLSRSFDLMTLIEDELLMEIPAVARHEICPQPVQMVVEDADFEAASQQKAQPFAVLQALKADKRQ